MPQTVPINLGPPQHPLGQVTGIDHYSGLPIVKRGERQEDAPKKEAAPKPQASSAEEGPGATPETHVFSVSQFKAANPSADAEAAAKEAMASGYEVAE